MLDWQLTHGLDQHIESTMRDGLVSGVVQQSRIDLVFTKEVDDVATQVLPSEASDHHLVVVQFKCVKFKQEVKFEKRVLVDWRNYTDAKMNAELHKRLSELNCDHSPEILDRVLTMSILDAMNKSHTKKNCSPKARHRHHELQKRSLEEKT